MQATFLEKAAQHSQSWYSPVAGWLRFVALLKAVMWDRVERIALQDSSSADQSQVHHLLSAGTLLVSMHEGTASYAVSSLAVVNTSQVQHSLDVHIR